MSLFRRGGQFHSRICRNGVTYRRALGVSNRKHALALEDDLRFEIVKGNVEAKPKPSIPTLEDYCTDFINYKTLHNAPTTVTAYMKCIDRFKDMPELADCPLDQIKLPLIHKFTQKCVDEDYAVASINLFLACLRAILHFAETNEVITKVPVIEMLRGANRREYVISEEDEKKLLSAQWKTTGGLVRKLAPSVTELHPTMKLLIPFLLDTGLRIGEACALTWADVTETEIRVRQGKTENAARTIPLTTRAAAILSQLRVGNSISVKVGSPAAPVFTRQLGAISDTWATQWFGLARKAAGLPKGCVLHSTRHTFCTRLANLGASSFELQKLAGHSSIVMTARYCHPDTEQLTSAINRLNKGEKK